MKATHQGFLSPKLLFVLIAALGVMGILFYLSRSSTFTTVEVNLSHSQIVREESLLEVGALERKNVVDGREVLNSFVLLENQKITADDCSVRFLADYPNETRLYENKKFKISFEFPYNVAWGNEKYYIYPFDENDRLIYFGPIFNQNCLWRRAYRLEINTRRSVSDLFTEIASKRSDLVPEIIKIVNKEVVVYTLFDKNNCEYPVYYLLGPDFDYEFSTICSDNLDNDKAFLDQIIRKVKFLP